MLILLKAVLGGMDSSLLTTTAHEQAKLYAGDYPIKCLRAIWCVQPQVDLVALTNEHAP